MTTRTDSDGCTMARMCEGCEFNDVDGEKVFRLRSEDGEEDMSPEECRVKCLEAGDRCGGVASGKTSGKCTAYTFAHTRGGAKEYNKPNEVWIKRCADGPAAVSGPKFCTSVSVGMHAAAAPEVEAARAVLCSEGDVRTVDGGGDPASAFRAPATPEVFHNGEWCVSSFFRTQDGQIPRSRNGAWLWVRPCAA